MILDLIKQAKQENRDLLYEHEVYQLLRRHGLDVPDFIFVKRGTEFDVSKLHRSSDKAVLKVVSPSVTHKSDQGGVCIVHERELKREISKLFEKFPEAVGVLVIDFLNHNPSSLGGEVMFGIRYTDSFGYVLTFGPGGTDAEHIIKMLKDGKGHRIAAFALAKGADWKKYFEASSQLPYFTGEIRGKKKIVDRETFVKWAEEFAAIIEELQGSSYEIAEFEINPAAPKDGKIFALDGLLRFSKKEGEYKRPGIQNDKRRRDKISKLLNPASVAVIGVSGKSINPGRVIVRNLIAEGFDKNEIFIIKPGSSEIDGCACYQTISELPKTVDVLVLSVDANQVPAIVRETSKHDKAHAIILISGGMAEKSGGEILEQQTIEELAAEKLVLNGGNCLGIRSLAAKFHTFFIPTYKLPIPKKGNTNVAIISQSGAFSIVRMHRFAWMNPLYNISTGNQTDLTVGDYLDYFAEGKTIKIFGVYLEGFKPEDGLRTAKSIRKITAAGGTVVVYKAGRTAAGRSAVQGHTASLAGDYATTRQVLTDAGAYMAESYEEFEDMLMLASFFEGKKFANANMFGMSNTGFECAGMADHLTGLQLGKLDDAFKQDLETFLKENRLDGIVSAKNPLDLTPMAADKTWIEVLQAASTETSIGSILCSNVPFTPALKTLPASEDYKEDMLAADSLLAFLKQTKFAKPVLFCVDAGSQYDAYANEILNAGYPVLRSIDRASVALNNFYKQKNKT